jgi:hypothetical protein
MSEFEEVPDGVDLRRGEADLAAATRQLRAVPPPAASVEIADRVLTRALAAPRRSVMVRAVPPHDHLRVSSNVIATVLRARLDADLRGAAVRRVLLDVDTDEHLTAVTVDLVVRYGTAIADLGAEVRALSRTVLDDTLGPATPGGEVPVSVTHAHVSDVTVGDPQLVDPADET